MKKSIDMPLGFQYSHNMIELLKEKKWSGDGWGQEPRILTQVKRSEKNAVYSVKSIKSDHITGFEVFKIKIIPKGHNCFNVISTDDEEKYPTAEQFGKTAWFLPNLTTATNYFNRLEAGQSPRPEVEIEESTSEQDTELEVKSTRQGRPRTERPSLTFPSGEFSVKELAEFNKVQYPIAFVFLKEQESIGKVHFVRDERRAERGKPTRLFKTS